MWTTLHTRSQIFPPRSIRTLARFNEIPYNYLKDLRNLLIESPPILHRIDAKTLPSWNCLQAPAPDIGKECWNVIISAFLRRAERIIHKSAWRAEIASRRRGARLTGTRCPSSITIHMIKAMDQKVWGSMRRIGLFICLSMQPLHLLVQNAPVRCRQNCTRLIPYPVIDYPILAIPKILICRKNH